MTRGKAKVRGKARPAYVGVQAIPTQKSPVVVEVKGIITNAKGAKARRALGGLVPGDVALLVPQDEYDDLKNALALALKELGDMARQRDSVARQRDSVARERDALQTHMYMLERMAESMSISGIKGGRAILRAQGPSRTAFGALLNAIKEKCP